MRVAITGSSGLIGTSLCGSLTADGHEIVRLVRRPVEAPDEVQWDPSKGRLDPRHVDGVDAVVNLAGARVGARRWTHAYKRAILSSRANATRTVAETVAKLDNPPRVLVSASAVGFYGNDHGAEMLNEEEPPGTSFLAAVCEEWEAATQPAIEANIAVCHARLGIVMSKRGGALGYMLPWFRAGFGGPLGGGDHYWSPISMVDAIRALRFLMETPGCIGPYNLTAPEPVTNAEFARVLAYLLRRPMLLPVPAIALQARFGQFAADLLASLRVFPDRLLEAGFAFDHVTAREVVTAALR
jgi:uncharacterized protein